MNGHKAVVAHGVSKQYRLGQRSGYELLSEKFGERMRSLGRGRPKAEDFWAIQDINFEVVAGETFGIIGHNGAGKSTLLKILSRVTPPTTGRVELSGRVGSLLEVGTGFHAELTGRENVYLNGAILGMRRGEIADKFDEIVEFSEIEQFIDTPVKRYSSGMYLRLAFAVAAHLEPEILVVDEVLSVGDLSFQEKCLGRMQHVAGEGRTVLFVSHNLPAVAKLCNRAMLLSEGRKIDEGQTHAMIEQYVGLVRRRRASRLDERQDREGTGRVRFTDFLLESGDRRVDQPVTGQDLSVVLRYQAANGKPARRLVFAVGVYTMLGTLILQCQSDVAGYPFASAPTNGEARLRLPRLPLPAGSYTVNLMAAASGEVADWVQHAVELTVVDGDYYGSGRALGEGHQSVLVAQTWDLVAVADAGRPLAAPEDPVDLREATAGE